MYKYKDILIDKHKAEKIEKDILDTIGNIKYNSTDNLKDMDYFLENISYIQKGKKDILEVLANTKYNLKEYLVSYQYGLESFSYNCNSVGIIYSILSLLNLKLYEQAELMFIKYKDKIIEIINSNKSSIDDIINILIYFKLPINYIDDISYKLENLKDKRKKYIYILVNLIEDIKVKILKNLKKQNIDLDNISIFDYKEYIDDIINIFRELKLYELEQLYLMKLNNNFEDINIYNMIPCDNLEEYICKVLLDIIDIKNSVINYTPNTISKYNYEDDFIKIISYQQNELVSMHILKINEDYIIIDCGASILNCQLKKIDIENFFKENSIDIKKVKCAIITHAHLDHYGSVDLLQNYVDKIYMTKDTFNIINLVSKECILNYNKVKIIKDNEKFSIGNAYIEIFPANHIKGSIGVCIEYKDKKIIYTGDFSFNKQATTRYIDENYFKKYKNTDYLIMESTNGNQDIDLPYVYKKKLFNYFVNLCIKNNIKIIIPAFAIGVAQECYDIINKSTVKANVLVDGLALKVNKYYNKVEKRFNINDDLNYNIKKNIDEKYNYGDVIIPTGGVVNDESIFQKYYKLAIQDKRMVTVLKCGHIDKNTIENKIKPHDAININFIDISLSSHAQYQDLIKTINTIKPKNLVTVHGNGIKFYNN